MSEEIESKVLAALVRDRYLLTRVMGDGFSPDGFREAGFRLIFKTLQEMSHFSDQVIDWITVESFIKSSARHSPEISQTLERLKGEETSQPDQVMAYLEILKDRNLRDRLKKLSNVMSNYATGQGQHKDEDFVNFSGRIIQGLIGMQKQKTSRRINPVKVTIDEIKEITNRPASGDRILGFSIFPFERLETLLSGIRKGFYYGIAGAPRRGKTTFTLDLASRLAERNNFPVLFYTWEQTRRTLAARLLGRECYINPVKLLTEVNPDER